MLDDVWKGGNMFNRKEHWEKIYSDKKPDEVSWYQANPEKSLELINSVRVSFEDRIIDVGGGASLLVDQLLEKGFRNLSVLDISENALRHAKQRLGHNSSKIKWIIGDATLFIPQEKYDIWHDRAVFHFLTESTDREKYISAVKECLKKGGFLILAAFAKDGPDRCSNLPVRQYDADLLQAEFGTGFELVRVSVETHQTPWGKGQKFNYFLLRKSTD
jgi:SAM-dependent methyltransferase